jgi:hypothetical protein
MTKRNLAEGSGQFSCSVAKSAKGLYNILAGCMHQMMPRLQLFPISNFFGKGVI